MRIELWQLAIFAALTACLVYVSRASLREPRSHGFYRFFSWECILGLFLLNAGAWLRDPFSWNQLIAWTLLIICVIPLVAGARSLRARGKPTQAREAEPGLLAFEKTTALVTTGIYRYIRHPLYSSLLFLTWGVFFKLPGWPGVVLAAASSLMLFATAKADEAECTRFFGPPYPDYMKKTKRFVPFLF